MKSEETKQDEEIEGDKNFTVGDLVLVAPRTFPGMNKHGGVARVTALHQDGSLIDVKYVLGGKESNLELKWVSKHDQDTSQALRERRSMRRASAPPTMMAPLQGGLDADEDSLISNFNKTIRLAQPMEEDEDEDPEQDQQKQQQLKQQQNKQKRTTQKQQRRQQQQKKKQQQAKNMSNDESDSNDSDEDMEMDEGVANSPAKHDEQIPGVATAEAGSSSSMNSSSQLNSPGHQQQQQEEEGQQSPLRLHHTAPLPLRPGEDEPRSAGKRRPRDATNVRQVKRAKQSPEPRCAERSATSPPEYSRTQSSSPATASTESILTTQKASAAERARQQSFRQLVARLFRIRQAEMMDAADLLDLVNQSNCENTIFTPEEFEVRLKALDEENRVMLRRDNNGGTSVWLV